MTRKDIDSLGWKEIDILLVTGDAYVDHPSFGAAIIGRVLIVAGYRVGLISQPNWRDKEALTIMGRPRLACAITSGNLDSMLNIYTPARRLRKDDDYSPGGKPGLRPPMALQVYSNLAKAAFPGLPVILGGIEASMRRIAHYDYWKDKILPSILLTSKADILIYGMGERAVLKTVEAVKAKKELKNIQGSAILLGEKQSKEFLASKLTDYTELPSFENIALNKQDFMDSHLIAEKESNPYCGKGLFQKYDKRIVVIEKPELPLSTEEMDAVYELPFANKPHPFYKEKIPAFEMIKNSITAVRGCPGGCSFCGLGLHQGKFVAQRSKNSILKSIRKLTELSTFRGTVSDIGGPTANVYGNSVRSMDKCKKCRRPSCLWPDICLNYIVDDHALSDILKQAANIEKVKHLFISSGIRLDLAEKQPETMRKIIHNHTSGHFKIAPEHLDDEVLKLMRKSKSDYFYEFIDKFRKETQSAGKEQYLVPYFISNFPGCNQEHMKKLDAFLIKSHWAPQQVQDFTPLPMTIASAMYYCETDTDRKPITVNKGLKYRREQLLVLKRKMPYSSKSKICRRSH
ncbi:MAG: YgiQ family radical SAM protein [Lentisphaerae bacterium GWF2_38_69]|nr:MAG: YgiQ family radical SAM protein [Lentisphaerae bacterium GWF2_38_69]